jgi:hypothetical protein
MGTRSVTRRYTMPKVKQPEGTFNSTMYSPNTNIRSSGVVGGMNPSPRYGGGIQSVTPIDQFMRGLVNKTTAEEFYKSPEYQAKQGRDAETYRMQEEAAVDLAYKQQEEAQAAYDASMDEQTKAYQDYLVTLQEQEKENEKTQKEGMIEGIIKKAVQYGAPAIDKQLSAPSASDTPSPGTQETASAPVASGPVDSIGEMSGDSATTTVTPQSVSGASKPAEFAPDTQVKLIDAQTNKTIGEAKNVEANLDYIEEQLPGYESKINAKMDDINSYGDVKDVKRLINEYNKLADTGEQYSGEFEKLANIGEGLDKTLTGQTGAIQNFLDKQYGYEPDTFQFGGKFIKADPNLTSLDSDTKPSGTGITATGLGNAALGVKNLYDYSQIDDPSTLQTLGAGVQGASLLNQGANLAGIGTGVAGNVISGIGGVGNIVGGINDISKGNYAQGAMKAGTGALAAGGALESATAIAPVYNAITGELIAGTGAGTGAVSGAVGSGVGSALGAIGSVASIAAPYYAAAKLGGVALDAIAANNPDWGKTGVADFTRSIRNPLQVEDYFNRTFSEHGGIPYEKAKWVTYGLNPINALQEWGIDTHICTATKKHSLLTETEEDIMKGLRVYALDKHTGWMKSYLKNGPKLIKAIEEQETDLTKFYDNIREILVRPVTRIFDTDQEKAYQIYLLVTQMLFSKYLPEFSFTEE